MFKCMECGRKFKTAKAAERAAFGDRGCPGCGGSDIDLDPGTKTRPLFLPNGSIDPRVHAPAPKKGRERGS